MKEVLGGALVGILAGLLSGAAGLGGAVISTPGIRLLGAAPLTAVGTTVPAIVVASATGSWNYLRSRSCDVGVAVSTATTGVFFTVLGALSTRPIGGRPLMLATACLVVYGGGRVLAGKQSGATGVSEESTSSKPPGRVGSSSRKRRLAAAAGIGVFAGYLSGVLGIGGGIVMIPAYFRLLGLPIKKTTGTSLLVAGVLAIPGTIAHWCLGNIDWGLAGGVALGALAGSYFGSRITLRSSERRVRIYVGSILVLIGLLYFGGEIVSWLSART